jgi:integrase
MGVYRRGGVYWFNFVWNGKKIQKSTRQGNRKAALDIESAHRTKLAKGELGLTERPRVVPTFTDFADKKFLPWVESTFANKPKTYLYYRNGVRRLKECSAIASERLSDITGEKIALFVSSRQSKNRKVSSINRELQVLRRALRLAFKWHLIDATNGVEMLPGESRRERVINTDEEARYLSATAEPLASIASVLLDSGMRPEECFRLQWENVSWDAGRNGTFLVTHGKTPAARRMLPMTLRVRKILEARWKSAGEPDDGWIWPAPTRSGHVEPSSLRKQHANAFKLIAEEAQKNSRKPVRHFVLYSLRHTFLTRLGEAGCDVWTLARIAGHSAINISSRYVHPSDDGVLDAMQKFADSNVKLLQ